MNGGVVLVNEDHRPGIMLLVQKSGEAFEGFFEVTHLLSTSDELSQVGEAVSIWFFCLIPMPCYLISDDVPKGEHCLSKAGLFHIP